MAKYITCATVLSSAVLAACGTPAYNANTYDANTYDASTNDANTHEANIDFDKPAERIVCKMEAPIGSNIKRRTCWVESNLSYQERKKLLQDGHGNTPFEMRPVTGSFTGNSRGGGGAAEGSCGGNRD